MKTTLFIDNLSKLSINWAWLSDEPAMIQEYHTAIWLELYY